MKQILIAEIKKTVVYDTQGTTTPVRVLITSFDKDKLIKNIEHRFSIVLKKDPADDFPYFTDGGFKFSAENKNFKFEIECHPYNIV